MSIENVVIDVVCGLVGGAFTLGAALATGKLRTNDLARRLEDFKVEHSQVHVELKNELHRSFSAVADGQRDLKSDIGASLADLKGTLATQRTAIDSINDYLRNGNR